MSALVSAERGQLLGGRPLASELLVHAPTGDLCPGRGELGAVADAALRIRMATLFGLGMLLEHQRLIADEHLATFEDLRRRDCFVRGRVVVDPIVRIWLRRALAIVNDLSVRPVTERDEHLGRFTSVVSASLSMQHRAVQGIGVARRSVDPLLQAVAPPTYEFSDVAPTTAYDLDLFADVARAAMTRIEAAWPELHAVLPRFVRLMIHVPDGTFRSASAARFAGAVFFSADDHSVLELEESIVHEFGHQILYEVMELDPLVCEAEAGTFVLPWSGSERDWYGYFHAFFIYVLLAEYLTRRQHITVGPDPGGDRLRVIRRRDEIAEGIAAALPDIVAGPVTPGGQCVIGGLRRRAESLLVESVSRVGR